MIAGLYLLRAVSFNGCQPGEPHGRPDLKNENI